MRAVVRTACWGLCLAFAACRSQPTAVAFEGSVAVSGCQALSVQGVCNMESPGPLVLWLPVEPAAATWTARGDDGPLALKSEEVDGGLRLQLTPPPGTRLLSLSGDDNRTWSLPLRWSTRPAWLAAVDDLDNAAALRSLLQAESGVAESEYPRWRHETARRQLRLGKTGQAIDGLASARQRAWSLGQRSQAMNSAEVESFLRAMETDFVGARAALDAVGTALGPVGPGRVIDGYHGMVTTYHRGVVAREAGDLREALRQVDTAHRWAVRLGHPFRHDAQHERALIELGLGRLSDSWQHQQALLAAWSADAAPCSRGLLLSNLGWTALRWSARQDVPPGVREQTEPLLREALAVYSRCTSQPPFRVGHVKLELAFAALARGAVEQARRWWRDSGAFDGEPRLLQWKRILEAELERAAGRPTPAAKVFADIALQAERHGLAELRWRARTGQGDALREAGQLQPAARAYQQAEQALLDASLRVPVDAGKGQFLLDREASARKLVDTQLRRGHVDLALGAARQARLRTMAGLASLKRRDALNPDQRRKWEEKLATYLRVRNQLQKQLAEHWRLPADGAAAHDRQLQSLRQQQRQALDGLVDVLGAGAGEAALPTRKPDEARLTWFPGQHDWHLFVEHEGGVTHARLPAPDRAGLVETGLLQHTAGAARLKVLGYGAARGVDVVGALQDSLSADRRPIVVHSMDLSELAPAASRDPALVVADPRGDLPRTRAEARDVVRRLTGAGRRVKQMTGEQVTVDSLRSGLSTTRWFHYAGHARAAGRDGWDGALLLAEGQLSVGDILTLPRVPETVLLLACEAHGQDERGSAAQLGVAQAFLLAGSRRVIASSTPLSDNVAAQLSAALYASLARGEDLEHAFSHAVRRRPLGRHAKESLRLLVR